MKHNYKPFFLLALFLLLAAAACGTSTSSEPTGSTTIEPAAAGPVGAPTRANCPEAPVGATLFTNAEDGFCLLLPDGYAVDDSLITETGGAETAVYIDSPLASAYPRLFITVEDANGRSLEEIGAAKAAAIEASSGVAPVWSTSLLLAGLPAHQFDQVPDQDMSRQLLLVANGRLYTFTFTPDNPASDAYADMQTLVNMVTSSFTLQ
ncbi:MAG: hypothetical protein IPM53_08945 [Anaerolineaceae bacterium]|nr:hypothetical protein [Anaerolineaceae bacterium]